MTKNNDPPPMRRARPVASDKEPAESYVRRLARDHCRGAMRALAAVAKDTDSPAAARITAATSLVAWALGYPPDGAPPVVEAGSSRRGTPEQVVRLSWMESKKQRRSPAPKPAGEGEKTGPGKMNGDKRGR